MEDYSLYNEVYSSLLFRSCEQRVDNILKCDIDKLMQIGVERERERERELFSFNDSCHDLKYSI